MNNRAVGLARGELVGLVNNDIEVIAPDWLTEMAPLAVGPKTAHRREVPTPTALFSTQASGSELGVASRPIIIIGAIRRRPDIWSAAAWRPTCPR